MSGPYWNLRTVLNIDPDTQFNCVGIAKTVKRKDKRCRIGLSDDSLIAGSRLLNKLESSKKFAQGDLDELAVLLLCKAFHNSDRRPHLNQIKEIADLWYDLIKEDQHRVKEEARAKADADRRLARRRNEQARATASRSMKADDTDVLLPMRDQSSKNGVQSSWPYTFTSVSSTIPQKTPSQSIGIQTLPSKTSASESKSNVDDPFRTQSSTAAKPNIFTQRAKENETPIQRIIKDSDAANTAKEASATEVKKVVHLSVLPEMPSPPTHEPSWPANTPREAILVQQERSEHGKAGPCDLETASISHSLFKSKSGGTQPPLGFKLHTDANTTSVLKFLSGVENHEARNPVGEQLSKTQKAAKSTARAPLHAKAIKPLNLTVSNRPRTPTFEFGSEQQQPSPGFEYKAPLRPRKLWEIEDASEYPAFLVNDTLSEQEKGFAKTLGISSLSIEKPESAVPSFLPSTSSPTIAISTRSRTPTYAFGSGEKTLSPAFEFEVPLTPRQYSKKNNPSSTAVPLFSTPPKDIALETPEGSSITFSVSEVKGAYVLPVNGPHPVPNKASSTPEPPTTPPRQESYGYANITPESTRYTTYLPARQQYGLVTPPETPEMLLRSLSKPMNDSGYFSGERRREPVTPQSPSPRVSRRPVPVTPKPVRNDSAAREIREMVFEESMLRDVNDAPPDQGERGGCLARFSFRRLKEKVKGQAGRSGNG